MSRNKVEPATTPWFPISVQPVRAGVYQVKAGNIKDFAWAHWSGVLWFTVCPNLTQAYSAEYPSSWMQDYRSLWRGLAQEPKQ